MPKEIFQQSDQAIDGVVRYSKTGLNSLKFFSRRSFVPAGNRGAHFDSDNVDIDGVDRYWNCALQRVDSDSGRDGLPPVPDFGLDLQHSDKAQGVQGQKSNLFRIRHQGPRIS